jgi:putative flippase GtrA
MNLFRFKVISLLLKSKTDNLFVQIFRYTFVGGLAFIVDFSLLYLLTDLFKIHYLVSAGISFIFGLLVNYLLSILWVFNSRKIKNVMNEFIFFTLIGLFGLGITEVLLWMLTDLFALYYLISKIITTIIVYFWNFFARKYLLFNK